MKKLLKALECILYIGAYVGLMIGLWFLMNNAAYFQGGIGWKIAFYAMAVIGSAASVYLFFMMAGDDDGDSASTENSLLTCLLTELLMVLLFTLLDWIWAPVDIPEGGDKIGFSLVYGLWLMPSTFGLVSGLFMAFANHKNHGADIRMTYHVLSAGIAFVIGFLPLYLYFTMGLKTMFITWIPAIIDLVLAIVDWVIIVGRKCYCIHGDGEPITFADIFRGSVHVVHGVGKEVHGLHKAIHAKDKNERINVKGDLAGTFKVNHRGSQRLQGTDFAMLCMNANEITQIVTASSARIHYTEGELHRDSKTVTVKLTVWAKDCDTTEDRLALDDNIYDSILEYIDSRSRDYDYHFKLDVYISHMRAS